MTGYIYIRENEFYNEYDVYKIGATNNIAERNSVYVSREIKRGRFIKVYEVPYKKLKLIENLIYSEFKNFYIEFDGGTQFYKKEIINLIDNFLLELEEKMSIKFVKLSNDDIKKLIRI